MPVLKPDEYWKLLEMRFAKIKEAPPETANTAYLEFSDLLSEMSWQGLFKPKAGTPAVEGAVTDGSE